jgi:uncharacterized membrane protein (DUF2068 family)
VIWYLIIERGLRGVLVLGLGVYGLTFARKGLPDVVADVQSRFGLVGSHGLLARLANDVLARLLDLSPGGLRLIAVAAILYGLLELAEAVGLLVRRRWAEYLVVVATSFGIPVEVRECILRPGWLRVALLIINIAVVIYLLDRKKLFQFDREEGL